MGLRRVCVAGAFAVAAFTAAAPANAASVGRDSYGPPKPQDVISAGAVPRVNAQCKEGAATGSVPVSVSFDDSGDVSGWTAKRATGDVVATGHGNVAVFGVQVDCRHPESIRGVVYFDVADNTSKASGAVVTAATKPVQFYVHVLPAADHASAQLSAPLLTGGAAIVLAGIGILGALRRVRSLTRTRTRTGASLG